MPDAFAALDAEWNAFVRSPAAACALTRWQQADARYRPFRDVAALRQAFEARTGLDERDSLMADLATRGADGDDNARLIVLAALRPGLVNLARNYRWIWGWEEAASIVMDAALVRLSRRVIHLPSAKVAASLLGSIKHAVWDRRQRERSRQADWGQPVPVDSIEELPANHEDPHREFLLHIDEAMRRGGVSVQDARIVALHRVCGYSNVEIAEMEGYQPCTIRKRRHAAELAIAEVSVA